MSLRLDGRNGEIYRAYLMGKTQEAIAEQHGIDQTRVSQIIKATIASIPEEDLAERRKRVLDGLDMLSQVAAEVMEDGVAQAWSNGRPMTNEDGTPILDYGARLAAVDRLLKIGERQAKLLGLDAAQRVDVAVSEQAKEAMSAAAAEAIARLAGPTEE